MPIKKISLLFFLSITALVFSLKFGAVKIYWSTLFDFFLGRDLPAEIQATLKIIRLPRSLASFYVGATLALAGSVLQALLKNPLADSYTLGISGGSAVGASFAMHLVFLPTLLSIPIFSCVGAILAVSFVLFLSAKNLQSESRSLILVGVMLSLFLGAVSVFSMSLLPMEKSQAALSWLMGEFGSSRDYWAPLFFLFSLAPIFIIFKKSAVLDALSLGDVKALSLGYKLRKEKIILIASSTLLTALAISISGLIGFIGLVSPHLARRFLKSSLHGNVLISSSLIGGILLVVADTLGRALITDKEIPAGSLAAVLGAPILIYLLLEKKNAQNE